MKKLIMAMAAMIAGAVMAVDTERGISYAMEDAAFQTATQINNRGLNVKKIAFVRMYKPDSQKSLVDFANLVTVFENGLSQVPSDKIGYVLHQDSSEDWKEIDRVFDAVADFGDYNPATAPRTGLFKVCDAFMMAKVIDARYDAERARHDVRVSVRLVKVETGEVLWGANVEGVYDELTNIEYNSVSREWRRAFDAAAKNAVAKLPRTRMDGYKLILYSVNGVGGAAMKNALLSALSESEIGAMVLDMPSGAARDRALGRFLRERVGTNAELSNSSLKSMQDRFGANEKLALLDIGVTTLDTFPHIAVDRTGGWIDILTGAYSSAEPAPSRWTVGCDMKIRDLAGHYAVIAATSAEGEYSLSVSNDLLDYVRSLTTPRNIILAALILLAVWFILKFMVRVR